MNNTGTRNLLSAIQAVDLLTFHWCRRRKCFALLAGMARQLSRSADGWMYLLLPMLYGVWRPDAAMPFVRLAATAYAVERLLYFILKNSCRRRRPTELLPDFRSIITAADRFSFPSGHTSAAFLFSGLCALEFGLPAALLLYPWALAVGVSRVVLGVHFPSDIVAGAVLGSTLLLLVSRLSGA